MTTSLLERAVSWTTMLVLTVGLSEVLVRLANPVPRVQVIRPSAGLQIHDEGGTPLWRFSTDPPVLRNEGCVRTGDGLEVAIVGDSILHWPFEQADRSYINAGITLQAKLDEVRPGSCVRNVSQPAYAGLQQAAELRALERTHPPDVVFWGVWKEDGLYARIGDVWVDVDMYPTDAAGYPEPPWIPLPSSLHHALMDHTRLWPYVVLALSYPSGHTRRFTGDPTVDDLHSGLTSSARRTVARGVPFVVVLLPPLDKPFAQTLVDQPTAWGLVVPFAQQLGLPVVQVAEHLVGVDPATIRIDTCCHFNEEGQQRLGGMLFDAVDWKAVVVGGR